jgi:RNA polymerase sigma-70 factor (ECF subfamily)
MWNDNEIIKGCRKGSRKAQGALYDKYAPVLRVVCRRYLGNSTEVEDVLHDAMLKALGSISKYKAKGSFEGWLKRITMNTALDYLKKRSKTLRNSDTLSIEMELLPEQVNEKDSSLIGKYFSDELSSDDLLSAISELPDGYRVVLNMYAVDECSHKEISAQLGISESTSKSQLSRARKLLKKNLVERLKTQNHVR